MFNEQRTQTAVSLNTAELQALIGLFRVAQQRLTPAEQLFFDGLFTRFDEELKAQNDEMLNGQQMMREAMLQPEPSPATGNVH